MLVLLIGAFLLAFVFMFIFPLVSLALVFLGMFGLGLMVVVRFLMSFVLAGLVRRLIHEGLCPLCGNSGAAFDSACPTCGAGFASTGRMLARGLDHELDAALADVD